jgi:hypothetical protein
MVKYDDEGTEMSAASTRPVIEKLNYSHAAMIDLLVANPMISQGELARAFGYTQPWISRILRSDSFREMLAQRKAELVDPLVLQSIEQRFEALVTQSLDILEKKLSWEAQPTADLALKAAELGSRALGYGAKTGTLNVQANFVVAMPEKAANSAEWLNRLAGVSQHIPPAETARLPAINAMHSRLEEGPSGKRAESLAGTAGLRQAAADFANGD